LPQLETELTVIMAVIKFTKWITALPRFYKQIIMGASDAVLLIISLWVSFSLRLGEWYLPSIPILSLFLIAPLIAVPVFIYFGLYRAVIRYLGMKAIWMITQAISLYAMLWAVMAFLSGVHVIPRSVTLINWFVALMLIGGSRVLARWWFLSNDDIPKSRNSIKHNVVIYGAGSSGVQLANALGFSQEYRPVAFLDDDPHLQKQQINALPVYGFNRLGQLIKTKQIHQVLLAMPSISRSRRREIVDKLEPFPVHVRTIPGMTDLVSGKAQLNELREVGLDDLLGRDPVLPQKELLTACIGEKNVLVTGAGGSIGSELCRQIILLNPKSIILYEISEYALYAIENELEKIKEKYNLDLLLIPLLGSVLDKQRLQYVLKIYEINTIYHAAAYKHVPLVEHNVIEGIKNNIFGTYCSAKIALEMGVETFVLISTDKAVRPTNIMGASKRFAELILQGLSQENEARTHYCMVRFGNVLGSSGSVVPLFQEQIQHGGPVTVTHPDIIRYFMTIPEAAQLVIQASAMGEKGEVFVLDMGEPVKIHDLAKRMIHLSGLTVKDDKNPDGDIEIIITGLRSGEKLYEELLIGDNATGTQHPRIMQAEETPLLLEELAKVLDELGDSIERYDIQNIMRILTSTVSGYSAKKGISDYLWQAQNPEVVGDGVINNDNIIELNDKLITNETK
jgi:FlaA1/EpsC-like NDP-sugar epimerase